MPTSPSSHVCIKLELWKLVLKKYLNRGISVSSNALGGYPYCYGGTTYMCTRPLLLLATSTTTI